MTQVRAFARYILQLVMNGYFKALVIFDAALFAVTLLSKFTHFSFEVPTWVYGAILTVGFIAAAFGMDSELRGQLAAAVSTPQGAVSDEHMKLSAFRQHFESILRQQGYDVKYPEPVARLENIRDGWEEVFEDIGGVRKRIVVGDGEHIHNLPMKKRS